MTAAVDRVIGAVERKERVAIHGDYDVDGITSTVILERAIAALGGDVTHFIPERIRDGYGLQPPAVERLARRGRAADHLGGLRHPQPGRPPRARPNSAST